MRSGVEVVQLKDFKNICFLVAGSLCAAASMLSAEQRSREGNGGGNGIRQWVGGVPEVPEVPDFQSPNCPKYFGTERTILSH